MESYIALIKSGTGEIVEKKSRFIGYTRSVSTEEEAFAFVEEIKKKHYDAKHNCFAYSIGTKQPSLRFSDDGEPQGTAGKPILEVINGSKINNICIVVTRYFGGTLLGTGGLIRAYTDAAKEALANSEIRELKLLLQMSIDTNYSDMGKIQYIFAQNDISAKNTEYTDNVRLFYDVPVGKVGEIKKKITEATSARAIINEGEEYFG